MRLQDWMLLGVVLYLLSSERVVTTIKERMSSGTVPYIDPRQDEDPYGQPLK